MWVIDLWHIRVWNKNLVCPHPQINKLDKAVAAANTFYVANPDHMEMRQNLEYYSMMAGVQETDFKDLEARPHMVRCRKLSRGNVLDRLTWCLNDMLMRCFRLSFWKGSGCTARTIFPPPSDTSRRHLRSFSRPTRSAGRCARVRTTTTDTTTWSTMLTSSNPSRVSSRHLFCFQHVHDVSISCVLACRLSCWSWCFTTDHYLYVLNCKQNCAVELASTAGREKPFEDFLPSHFNYLQFSFYNSTTHSQFISVT